MTIGVVFRLVTVMVLWATCFPLIAMGLDQTPHLAFAALRAALAGIFLGILAILMRRPWPQGRRVWTITIFVALGTTSLGFLGMFHAAEFISPGAATVIANAQPLLAAVLGHIFLGERLDTPGKVGLLVGFIGIVIISWSGIATGEMQAYQLGMFYIGLALLGVAIGNIGLKTLAGKADPMVTIGVQFVLGAVPLAIISFITEDVSSIAWSMEFIANLLVLSILGTAVAYWMWFKALAVVPLAQANAFTYLVPVFGLTIGAIVFGERIGPYQIAGATLILFATYLIQRDFARSTWIKKRSGKSPVS